jgi:hypothetical protein
MTRSAFAHTAVVELDGDERAPGGAVTKELCGSWDHEPPCPLAPHHTATERYDGHVRLRVLFACEPDHEAEVRSRIEKALHGGEVDDPDGRHVTWRLVESGPAAVRPDERDHATRLAGG